MIPVGSAGLAEAMAAAWTVRSVRLPALPDRLAARESRDACARPSTPKNPRILILVTSLNPVSRAQVGRLTEAFPDVVVMLAPAERVGNKSVAERLAADFAERVKRETWDVLGFVGGDGARAALRCLGASAIQIVDAILEGIPLGLSLAAWLTACRFSRRPADSGLRMRSFGSSKL